MEMEEELYEILSSYLSDTRVQQMKQYIQHGSVSTYDHCLDVARKCLYWNRTWNMGADREVLVTAAFLHDLYLYDWHDKDGGLHRLHGFQHPARAAKNARRYLHVSPEVQQAIRTHMWPLTITQIPRSKEAWILCMIDKYVSLVETVRRRNRRGMETNDSK